MQSFPTKDTPTAQTDTGLNLMEITVAEIWLPPTADFNKKKCSYDHKGYRINFFTKDGCCEA